MEQTKAAVSPAREKAPAHPAMKQKSMLRRVFLILRPYLMIAPAMAVFILFLIYPIVYMVYLSFFDWNMIGEMKFIGVQNYADMFADSDFWQVLGNTCRYIVLYIPCMLAASLAVACLLSQSRRGVTAFRVIYYIPVLTSWVAASLIWKSVLSPQYGALNNFLALFGIQGPGWLLDEVWAMPAIVLVSVWKDMGFFGLILLSGMIGIDRGYYEAASLDGAGPWARFWRITLPLMTPAIFYVLIVSLINAFQLFPQIMIMTDGGPNGATQVMVERIYKYGFRYYRMGYAAAFSWILFAIIMVCTFIQMKGQKRWVNYDT